MAHILPRRVPYVCRSCRWAQASQSHSLSRTFATTISRRTTLRQQLEDRSDNAAIKSGGRPTNRIQDEAKRNLARVRRQQIPAEAQRVDRVDDSFQQSASLAASARPRSYEDRIAILKQALKNIQEEALLILEFDMIPEDGAVRDLLERAQMLANAIVNTQPTEGVSSTEQQIPQPTPAQESRSSLLADLNESQLQKRAKDQQQQQLHQPSVSLPPNPSEAERSAIALALTKTLYTLLEDPKVYISERILTSYVTTVATLRLPQYLPKIFNLYAHKPIPKPNSHPIKYTTPWSRSPKYAIPPSLIDLAIESAISVRDMPLCITLIDQTVTTPQFRTAKFLRKAAIPLTLSASIIPLSWALSTRAAAWQLSWDPETFWWMCMAGSAAYLGTMGTLLLITITTWNDHHKRVRWVPGTPLGRRWFREEERQYFDRVAQSWGYQDEVRHGEEVGEEWEALRECLALRYLELDRSSLLPGML